ncbi:hypothetical protein [Sphingomonas sp.]|uniref:hypothetical protein n=1 Tax=Sphingomonas sp. TaxID=28214 RepID=UPI0025ECE001|nr:hypothetical protein [Sphingomonas sp.]MBV9528042.1 hypothetical protein [Sphingomonas sp.]
MRGDDRNDGSSGQGRWGPPDYHWPKLSDGDFELLRRRQRDRARITAWLLGAFVVLLFFITIAKTSTNW